MDFKIYQKDRKAPVMVGSVVRIGGTPHYVEHIKGMVITGVSMDERRVHTRFFAPDIGLHVVKGVATGKRTPVSLRELRTFWDD